ncbi:hypothetical protein [Pseudomonas chlororaphis]|uniref:hypothetical protein n=1 Tax=Pseudomonas chlororaphis TaxID=587753 RepID=UPI0039E1E245
MNPTCYMCEKPATSREHAPPRCLFPKREHSLNGKDLRVNMITVPSCDEHNGEKSADDTYLMQILPMSIGLNDVAEHYFQSKVGQVLASNKRLVKSLDESAVSVMVHDIEKDQWAQAMAFKVDMDRLMSVLDMNARAIYFHHRGVKLAAKMSSVTNFSLLEGSPKLNDMVNQGMKMADDMLNDVGASRHGNNPDVFFYRIAREGNVELIEFTFYGTSKVLFTLIHDVIE